MQVLGTVRRRIFQHEERGWRWLRPGVVRWTFGFFDQGYRAPLRGSRGRLKGALELAKRC
jgi:hypothetical protein